MPGPGLHSYVIETLVTLLAVVALALLVLAAARRLGIGRPAGPIELVGRLPLDGRRAVYLVRVGKRVFVLACSEAGLASLGEVDASIIPEPSNRGPSGFSEVLARALGRASPSQDATKPSKSSPEGGD